MNQINPHESWDRPGQPLSRRAWLIGISLLVVGVIDVRPLAAEDNAPPSPAPTPIEKATGAAAWQRLVGNTVVAQAHAGGYTEYYAADGSLIHLDKDGRTKGRWSLEGNKVCFDFPEEDDRSCVSVQVDGQSGAFVDEDGARDTFDLIPGNAKSL